MRFVFISIIIIYLLDGITAQNKSIKTSEQSPGEEKQETIHALLVELNLAHSPQTQLRILDSLSLYYLYFSTNTDSSLFYSNKSIELALTLEDKRPLILAYARRANYFWQKTNLKAALESSLQGINLSKELNIPDYLSTHYANMVSIYQQFGDGKESMRQAELEEKYAEQSKDPFFDLRLLAKIEKINSYLIKSLNDSAFMMMDQVLLESKLSTDPVSRDIGIWYTGRLYFETKNFLKADSVFREGVYQCKKNYDNQILNAIYNEYAYNFLMLGDIKKSIATAQLGLRNSQMIQDHFSTSLNANLLYDNYEKLGLKDSSLYYLKMMDTIRGKIFSSTNISGLSEVFFSDQIKQKENQANRILQQEKEKSKLRLYGFFIALGVFSIIGIIIFRNNKQRAKSFVQLQQQKNETEIQKSLAEQALEQLKSTQTQLIQKEKMAALGELTAGIAHEIQNPLNFVNNFSEVNSELIEELKSEKRKVKSERDENLEEELLDNIRENEEKIIHHGKRADAIVKSMLQHSRGNESGNKKEPTDINALAEEYLRLAYHSFQSKHEKFHCELELKLDSSLPLVNIIPQDIGRVLLNIFNNAFWACAERGRLELGDRNLPTAYLSGRQGQAGSENAGFDLPSPISDLPSSDLRSPISVLPQVTLTTKKLVDKSDSYRIEIRIHDNGTGIPPHIIGKIFQPFFTTKPTGQGTGLGLSLSYDVVKAHGGEIRVETIEGEGTEFIIQLPI